MQEKSRPEGWLEFIVQTPMPLTPHQQKDKSALLATGNTENKKNTEFRQGIPYLLALF